MKKKHVAIGCGICSAGLVLLMLTPIGGALLFVLVGMGHIRGEESFLNRPDVYEPVLQTLPLYCQSDTNLIPEYISYAWFPEPLRSKGTGRGYVSPSRAGIEMGGGFHHFGYHVVLDKAQSTGRTNVWALYFYSEGSDDRLLSTERVPASAELSATQIVAIVVAGFDARIQSNPKDSTARKGRIMSLLRYGQLDAAAESCRDWTTAQPTSWLAQYILAHLTCRTGDTTGADQVFTSWVRENENFAHDLYLALFNMREGRSEQALSAVRAAMEMPFVESRGTSGNKFLLGHNGAIFAFLHEDYDLSLSMCEKMLADSREEPWWRRKVWKLKAATLALQGKAEEAESAMSKCLSFEKEGFPDDKARDQELAKAIREGDMSFVRDYARWKDELYELFSPFDTDETGIHGRENLPSPYPADWKKNVGF